MSYLGFGKGSGPGGRPNSQPSFGNFPRSASDSPSPTLVNPSPPQPHSGHDVWKVQPPLSQNSGPAPSFQNESTGIIWGAEAAATMSVPTPGFQSIKAEGNLPNSAEFYRPVFNTPVLASFPKKVSSNDSNLKDHRDQSVVQSSVGSYDLGRSFPIGSNEAQATKRTRSPILPSVNNIHHNNSQPAQNNHTRTSVSPPGKGFRSDGNYGASYSNTWSRSSETNKSFEAIVTKATILPIPKRTRSPPLEQDFEGNFNSPLDDSESFREIQAKAKRLARFKAELSETTQKGDEIVDENAPVNKQELFMVGKPKYVVNRSTDLAGDSTTVNPASDYEGLESSGIIIGSCPDMCPESEREERERKGDLDRYERLDGDRNQTNKFLAVKKYTRTAEREASLIRPIAVLQKTIDYLLSLLDQPYDESLLGIYNFLWDRMRAIRMDLRMQHIFNQEAVTMLEQMIRLHIIAMHELCEYSKGEGFSEGFDAHLNIEQMNKTSVELFQMYNDHRKKGIHLPSEKDFRGYYALLKLDKHPGYRVEPAELSLDLAKMTPEIRQTPEVLFARDVARACRAGNFIAFFRLARRASYLQACLMHAHFSKLRTQALASLHSGLPNNQGLPVSHVAKWLGMEEEDIESLLEYHGFQLKVFEEPYVVRDGPFLNKDKDYPTKCSKLVHMKKANRIVVDVSPANQIINLPAATNKIQYPKINKEPQRVLSFEKKFSFDVSYPKKEYSVQVIDEEMPEMETSHQEGHHRVQPPIVTPVVGRLHDDHQIAHIFPAASDGFQEPFSVSMSTPPSTEIKNVGKPSFDGIFGHSQVKSKFPRTEELSFPIVSKAAPQDRTPGGKHYYAEENLVPPRGSFLVNLKDEELSHNNKKNKDDETQVAEAKLRLIIRLWKRRSMKIKELREQRILAANTALNLLSMGPPIQLNKEQAGPIGVFDIDCVMMERHKRHQLSWSSLNVSDVVAEKLKQRNPCSKCICWKVVVCSQWSNSPSDNQGQNSQVAHSTAGAWLLSKVMPSNKNDVNLVFTTPGLSIWKKWAFNQSDIYGTCCLSIVKDVKFDNLDETMAGASAILFVISENIPWDLQKVQLHRLVMSIPLGSSLPLLILIGLYHHEISDISSTLTDGLSLHKIDKSRVSSFLVVPLIEKHEMELSDGFFSDKQLREGLQWLAEEAPQQPALHTVRTNELILTHLNSSLEVLNNLKDNEVGPNVCISAFNNALDRTLAEVCSATEGNPTSWPCPEISMLPESSAEQTMVSRVLPTIGWSLPDNVEPLKHVLMDLKLPPFPDDISQLTRSSNMRKEIDICRAHLETCLVRYLTKSSKMLGGGLATKEACIMLQRYAYLEHKNFGYSIVPKWIMIFRRIINWRLMSLTSGVHSFTYVLDSHRVTFPTGDENSGLHILSPNHQNQPSLDEIIEVSYGTLLCGEDQTRPESNQILPNGKTQEIGKVSYLKVDETVSCVSSVIIPCFSSGLEETGLEETGRDIVVACRVNKEGDNLSMLLEQCKVLQNMIDDKLSVYF